MQLTSFIAWAGIGSMGGGGGGGGGVAFRRAKSVCLHVTIARHMEHIKVGTNLHK